MAYDTRDLSVGAVAADYDIRFFKYDRYELQLNVTVPPYDSVFTTSAPLPTKARMQVRSTILSPIVLLDFISTGVAPNLTVDVTNFPLVVIRLVVGATQFNDLTFQTGEDLLRRTAQNRAQRVFNGGVYDLLLQLGVDPEYTIRLIQGSVTLSHGVTRPIPI